MKQDPNRRGAFLVADVEAALARRRRWTRWIEVVVVGCFVVVILLLILGTIWLLKLAREA